MQKPHASFLSHVRQKISQKLSELKRLYLGGCEDGILFHGQAATVYRKCGKANCKCSEGGRHRHGPYNIIRIFRDGKNTQVTLSQDEQHFIEMAKRYEREVARKKQIVTLQDELLAIFEDLLEQRTIWSKKEFQKRK